MILTVFKSKVDGSQVSERSNLEVADLEAFQSLIKELEEDEEVDSVLIGLDPLDKETMALDILLR